VPFVKLDTHILDKSIWDESPIVCKVWITLLAMSDQNGIVEAAIPGIASRARVSIEDAKISIEKFIGPDEFSTNSDNEGRRIDRIQEGYKILNYENYRQRDYGASTRQKRHRVVSRVTSDVSRPSYVYEYESSFDIFWKEYPRKENKSYAKTVWMKLKPDKELFNKIIYAVDCHKKKWNDPQYIPHASTWLNKKRWEDEMVNTVFAKQSRQGVTMISSRTETTAESIEILRELISGSKDEQEIADYKKTLDGLENG